MALWRNNDFLNNIQHGDPPLPNSWFAYTIIFFYLAYNIVYKFIENYSLALILLSCITIIYIVVCSIVGLPPFWYITSYGFVYGLSFKHFEDYYTTYLNNNRKCSFFISLGLCLLIVLLQLFNIPAQSMVWGLCVPLIILNVVFTNSIPNSKIISWIGLYSYEIYLTHGIIIKQFAGLERSTINDILLIASIIIFTPLLSFLLKKTSTVIAHIQF